MASENRREATVATSSRTLLLGALGVVYGDIGTSPLYAIKASLTFLERPGPADVLGLLSLLFWMLMIVVSLKYVMIIVRADNRGEGGTLALLELALRGVTGRRRWLFIVPGLIGACLFYGDSVITPAISVLSAIEGIRLVSHTLDAWIVPVSVAVLALLFLIQSRGTGAVGRLFGPVMLLWFGVMGGLGAWHIAQAPQILQAVNPAWAIGFIAKAPWTAYVLLGALVLAVTGAESLYADMGHFGRSAVRRAWFGIVLPALLLCYFGQGALILSQPGAMADPFFLMAPAWALAPLVALATAATVIASQSVISGAFSVTRQAVQLGFWPRMAILHTSAQEEGQVYLPRVNVLLFVSVTILVLSFGSSDKLAHAYGLAVTGTMLMTSLLAFAVLPHGRGPWGRVLWTAPLVMFLLIDIVLFSSNMLKLLDGGWVPLLIGGTLFTLMATWKQGRESLHEALAADQPPLASFMEALEANPPMRVPGTAVFMSMIAGTVPPALLHNLKHNKVLHEQILFLTVQSADVPYVPLAERCNLTRLSETSWQAIGRWGFKEEPNVPVLLKYVGQQHPELNLDPMRVSYFLSRQTIIVVRKLPLHRAWRRRLFAFMARNASRSTRFYRIPPNRVVEMGMQMEL
ncbi:potassium transporter Kup [Parapusillimonas granuli]|nr:potassium transporter Kup [Parapusillimonas granuli]MBB5217301.1 KUP system potassium uptake protein [Parapusillimonas granuli]MEB2399314.1 potassium transporter Kup [Alcaligenaceae bacterium]